MKVKNVMTKNPVILKQSDDLKAALRLFSRHKISGCPVVSSGRVVGMITQTDVIKVIDVHSGINVPGSCMFQLVISVIKSGDEMEGMKGSIEKVLKMPVKNFMKTGIVTIESEEDVYTAARLMNKHGINRLPVVENGKIKGIITRADIVNVLAGMK